MRAADNPFRSSAIESLQYEGASAQTLFNKWISLGMRGSIVGPHGSGKTTLLCEILAIARAHELEPHLITLREENGRILTEPKNFPKDGGVIFIDGIDLLPSLLKTLRHANGIFVTTHVDMSLPILHRCIADTMLLRTLIFKLLHQHLDELYLETLFQRKGGNIREIFRSLYDEYSAED